MMKSGEEFKTAFQTHFGPFEFCECSFAQEKISYLGHVISVAGVSSDPTKLEAIA